MNELLGASAYFGVFVSLLAYGIGKLLRKKWKLAMLNPILIAVVLIIVLLSVCHIDYTVYNEGDGTNLFLVAHQDSCGNSQLPGSVHSQQHFCVLGRSYSQNSAPSLLCGAMEGFQ